jgi:hypothetical protein
MFYCFVYLYPMSDEAEKKVVKNIQKKLNEIDKKMAILLGSGITEEVYKLLMQKHNLISDGKNVVTNKYYCLMFSNMLDCNSIQTQLYKTKQEFEEQIADIITRLESLEKRPLN